MRTRVLLLCCVLWCCSVHSTTNSLHFPSFFKRRDKKSKQTTTITSSETQQQQQQQAQQHSHCSSTSTHDGTIMNKVLSTTARCTCGKVKFAIETLEQSPPMRLVCYCSDCRGYYETLDRLAMEKGLPPSAILDVSTAKCIIVVYYLVVSAGTGCCRAWSAKKYYKERSSLAGCRLIITLMDLYSFLEFSCMFVCLYFLASLTLDDDASSWLICCIQNWGGVDWTAMYPRDITILEGKDLLKTTIIRPTSGIRQVYASCCNTPMFRFGEMSMVRRS